MKVKVMQVGPIGTNCYILEDDKTNKAAVIDPGDEADKIAQVLQKDGAEVEYILLTHGHYDHTTGVPDLKKRFPDAQVYIHQADANGPETLQGGRHPHPGFSHHPGDGDPGTLPRLRHPAGGGRALYRRHPVLRLLRPHRPAGGQL